MYMLLIIHFVMIYDVFDVGLMLECCFLIRRYVRMQCKLCSADANELDLDGQGGRKFLRVLLNLVMHNYPQLVTGALQLLFRHFSQRQEVLQAFKQVSPLSFCFQLVH
jgi:hypothetical protein